MEENNSSGAPSAVVLPAAFYILPSRHILVRHINAWHLPYTAWFLSFAVLGSALAKTIDWGIFAAMLAALFLGLGITGHYLDLLKGDPLRQNIPRWQLWMVAIVAVVLAVAIGIWLIYTGALPLWFAWVIGAGVFLAFGYNLEWPGMHGDWQFSAIWGIYPVVVGALSQGVEAASLALWGLCLAALLLSRAQRALSFRARYLRRKLNRATVLLWDVNGLVPEVSALKGPDLPDSRDVPLGEDGRAWMLEPMETALMLLSFAMPLLAVAVVVGRA
jgi:hypothetical protein